ncbi:hypothetical protein FLLO111716_08180 [Flavobacterium longum]|uniref:hypothetical protein n=1 Tax=Flavobacterium longum TaxID=1299340 RepID=UPI0039EB4DC6
MKKFLIKLSLYSLPFLVAFIGAEVYLRFAQTSYTIKDDGLREGKAEILILGNSHMNYAADPSRFSMYAFNASNVAQSLYFDKRITLKHLDHLPKLKFVLIGMDFHSLSFSSQDSRDIWSYLGYGIAYKDSVPFSSKISYVSALTPKIAFEFVKRGYSGDYDIVKAVDLDAGVDLSKPIEKGYVSYPSTGGVLNSEFHQRTRAKAFNHMVWACKERPAIIADLEGFIVELQKRGVTPIFVTAPCYAPYVKMLDARLMAQHQREIDRLTEKYGVKHWDYLNMPLPEKAFHDYDHLSALGARIFSDTLNHRLQRDFISQR